MTAPERILLYGQEGTGKTRTIFAIAKKMRQTGSPGHVHLIDLDYPSSERMKVGYPDWAMNMTIYTPDNYDELLATVVKVKHKPSKDCWLCIDGMGEAWDATQEGYAEKVAKTDLVSWSLENVDKNDFGKSASAQKKMWREIAKGLRTFPGHVLCCSPSSQVMMDRQGNVLDQKQSRYVEIGWKPEGQNTVGYLFHSVLYMSNAGDRFLMTSVKDRERELMRNKVVGDFVMDYLVKVAGWTL